MTEQEQKEFVEKLKELNWNSAMLARTVVAPKELCDTMKNLYGYIGIEVLEGTEMYVSLNNLPGDLKHCLAWTEESGKSVRALIESMESIRASV